MTHVLLKDRLAHKLTRAIARGSLYPVSTLLPGEMELMKRGRGLEVHGERRSRSKTPRSHHRTPHVRTRVISRGSAGFGQQLSTL